MQIAISQKIATPQQRDQPSNEYGQSFFAGRRLYRDANNKIIGGVCSGIAAYFNIEPIIVRLVFIFSGIGFIAYILLWAFVPSSDNVKTAFAKGYTEIPMKR